MWRFLSAHRLRCDWPKLTFYQNDRGKGGEGGEAGVDGDDNFRADTIFNAFTAFISVS
jgi:hypothetical protein